MIDIKIELINHLIDIEHEVFLAFRLVKNRFFQNFLVYEVYVSSICIQPFRPVFIPVYTMD
jgi:hypothetical protein